MLMKVRYRDVFRLSQGPASDTSAV